ncbi:mannitol dehydrogenase family protein [Fodinicola acaciae]|uniref:mannitol dehydrogenase family protein n=1 Tax=Fodinicola acaciae TaxID=2681555 RepID=UPI0013CFD23A|nr:mannitol dehydrogenase family protein [Fodinicola acaciae]
MVHLGLGVFHRSHQAWYTEVANRAGGDSWRYASFTGRKPDAARALAAQDGAFTLLVRESGGDRAEHVSSIAVAADGADRQLWTRFLAAPQTALVTLTVTEAGYRLRSDGRLDTEADDVRADVKAVIAEESPRTAVARLVDGLRARHRDGGRPIAIVSCDNLPGNGEATRRAVLDFADLVDGGLTAWISRDVSFVSTMVDRITPAVEPTDLAIAERLTGWPDQAPVVAEPFTDWVLAGDFPCGRPDWEVAGARFVDDVTPYEMRKLFLLNAGHSMLAYLGLARGHATVFDAVSDPVCREAVGQLWSEATVMLPFGDAEIEQAKWDLLLRWGNPRIEHQLTKIALDGSEKLRVRVAPILRQHTGVPLGSALLLAAWLVRLRNGYVTTDDPGAAQLAATARHDLAAGALAVVRHLAAERDDHATLAAAIADAAADLEERSVKQ